MAARARSLILVLTVAAMVAGLVVIRRIADARHQRPTRDLFPTSELRIGIDPSNPPFAVLTATDLFGLEVDLGRALGQRLDLPVRFVNLGFDGLFDALKADQVDALLAGLTIDYSRLEFVHYSQPYFNAGLVLVSDQPIRQMTDLPGHRLAYEFGSEADTEAHTWLRRILPFEPRPYELAQYALDAARVGQADAALVEAVSGRLYLRDHRDWQAAISTVTDVPYAVATQSRRPEVSAVIQAALQSLIDDGTVQTLLDKWL